MVANGLFALKYNLAEVAAMAENNARYLPHVPGGADLEKLPAQQLWERMPDIDYWMRVDIRRDSGIRVDYSIAPGDSN